MTPFTLASKTPNTYNLKKGVQGLQEKSTNITKRNERRPMYMKRYTTFLDTKIHCSKSMCSPQNL